MIRFAPAALLVWAAFFPALPGCVSVRQHEELQAQLVEEQRARLRDRRRVNELESVVEHLKQKSKVLELERDLGRRKLSTLKVLPTVTVARPSGLLPAGEVLFASGSSDISEADKKKIASLARKMVKAGYREIRVEGHADPRPIDRTQDRFRSNMHLSAMRGLAVYHELVKVSGIDPKRVSVGAFGEHRSRKGDEKLLRRAEILYLPGPARGPKKPKKAD